MILFLDFDGVLHPDPPTQQLPLWWRAALLSEWLNMHPQVDVVISSTWRVGRTLDMLRDLLPSALARRVVGATGQIHEALYARQLECEAWMRSNRPTWRSWAALDDRAWNFRLFEKPFVLCDRRTGLTSDDLSQLDLLARD